MEALRQHLGLSELMLLILVWGAAFLLALPSASIGICVAAACVFTIDARIRRRGERPFEWWVLMALTWPLFTAWLLGITVACATNMAPYPTPPGWFELLPHEPHP